MKIIFTKEMGVVPRKAAKFEKVSCNKKNDLWHRKTQDRQIVGHNLLHIMNPTGCGSSMV